MVYHENVRQVKKHSLSLKLMILDSVISYVSRFLRDRFFCFFLELEKHLRIRVQSLICIISGTIFFDEVIL